MPPKNTKKTKKNNGKEQGGASPSQERIRRERTRLNVEMKSFQQPTIKDSLASQGMTLRGCTVRAGQGDMREGTYMELIGSDKETKLKEKPQPPLKDRENTLSPPPHPTQKPLVKDPRNPPPLCFSDSTEMSTDEYNKVSTQFKQAAKSLNKNDQHPLDVPSMDSEVFPSLAKARADGGTDQVHSADIDSKLKNDSEARSPISLGIRQEELPQKPLAEQVLSKLQEPSDTDTTNNTGSSKDEIPSGYMIPTLQLKDLNKGKTPFNLSEFKEQQIPKDSISKHTISELPEMITQEQPLLGKLNEWGVKKEQRIKFDKGRHIYVFAETLRPVILSNQDQICHLPSLTYYAVSTPRYIYYEVESTQERPGWNMLYNIDIEIGHQVVSITRVREMYSESLDQFPYITPSPMPVVSESASPYWTERREEITDKHLVTLGKHQKQFLGSLNPKGEVEPKPGEKALVNEVKGERVPKTQGSKDPEKNDREELIQSLIRSNGHLAANVVSLKRSLEEIANELRFNNKEKEYDNKYDIDRQVQLVIHLKEKQLEELKEVPARTVGHRKSYASILRWGEKKVRKNQERKFG